MIYVASKASIDRYPSYWRHLRDECGWPINSTWIDEAGEGQTADWGELWERIVREISEAKGILLWVEDDAVKTLKGAYVEVGIALGQGKRIAVVAPGVYLVDRSTGAPQHGNPIGTWYHHPLVRVCDTLREGLDYVLGENP